MTNALNYKRLALISKLKALQAMMEEYNNQALSFTAEAASEGERIEIDVITELKTQRVIT